MIQSTFNANFPNPQTQQIEMVNFLLEKQLLWLEFSQLVDWNLRKINDNLLVLLWVFTIESNKLLFSNKYNI